MVVVLQVAVAMAVLYYRNGNSGSTGDDSEGATRSSGSAVILIMMPAEL